VVFLACFTTGAALVSVTAEYFSKISKGRYSYRKIVVITSLFAVVVTNFGLETIINFAAPILFLVYPAAIVIILLSFFDKYIENQNIYKFSSFGTILYSLFELLSNSYFNFQFIESIPLSKEGLSWVLPAIVFGFIGFLIRDKKSCSKV
jgi:LIVCS family branched-chain amino acid:cation transporter